MRRLAALVLTAVLLTLVAVWAGPAPAYACSCGVTGTDADYVAGADVVFSGTVIDDQQGEPRTLTFAVDRVYKGAVTKTQNVLTAGTSSGCGVAVDGPGPYLVFARQEQTGLTAGLCGGTRAGDAPASLGAGQPPQPDPSRDDEPGPLAGRLVPILGLALAASAAGLVGFSLIRRRPR